MDSVAVVSVGLSKEAWNWYSNGSLIKIGNKYYPYGIDTDNTTPLYYNYDSNVVYRKLDAWYAYRYSVSVFDQVPSDLLTILSSGEFELVPDT